MNLRVQSPKRTSLSPLRVRKLNPKSIPKSNEASENVCENHNNKLANYAIQSERESLFYCKHCAVRLASQGFEVKALQESPCKTGGESERVSEIHEFLENL